MKKSRLPPAAKQVRSEDLCNSPYYVSPTGGLGNRIKTLVSALKIRGNVNKNVLVYWSMDQGCGCPYTRLFELNSDFLLLEKKLDRRVTSYWRLDVAERDVPESYIARHPQARSKISIDFEYERIPQNIIDIYVTLFNQLKPVDEVMQLAKKTHESFGEFTIGVHVRQGDFLNSEVKRKKRSDGSITKYFMEIDRKLATYPGAKVFLTTDSFEAEIRFREKFDSNKLVIYEKRSFSRKSILGVQDALVDLSLLSRCDSLILSDHSTFSEVAWWYGACKTEVSVIQSWQN